MNRFDEEESSGSAVDRRLWTVGRLEEGRQTTDPAKRWASLSCGAQTKTGQKDFVADIGFVLYPHPVEVMNLC
jgi:hypothetical protein